MTSGAPRVTVLVPSYNCEKFVARTLRSLHDQTFGRFAVRLVDDGSTDGTLEVARAALAGLDAEVLARANVGITANWNRAVASVDTEYFTLLHCDDVYEPAYLATMVDLLDAHPAAALAHCAVTAIDEADRRIRSEVDEYKLHRYFSADRFCHDPADDYRLLMTGNYVNCPAVMYRTAAARRIGPFNEAFTQVQDWEYWFRVLAEGLAICGTRERLFRYRRHPENTTSRNARELTRYAEEVRLLEWAHARGLALGWLAGPVDFGVLKKTVLSDVLFDLRQGDRDAARAKIDALARLVPAYRGGAFERFLRFLVAGGRSAAALATLGLRASLPTLAWLEARVPGRHAP